MNPIEWFLVLRVFLVGEDVTIAPQVWGPVTAEQCMQALNNAVPQIEQRWRQSGLAFEGHSWTLTCENEFPEEYREELPPEQSSVDNE